MANVTLHLLNIFALKVKKNAINYNADTVGEVISQFLEDHGDKLDKSLMKRKKLADDILILVNGKNVDYLDGYKTKLSDEDKIYISIPLSGG